MEMVLSCLRVLRHHNVIALIDMFFFTNRYECTEKAALLLTGKEEKLLSDAVEFVMRRPPSSSSGDQTNTPNSPSHRFMEHAAATGRSTSLPDQQGSFPLTSYSHDTQITPANRRVDYVSIKIAISELYNAFHQGTSIGDLWIALVSGDLPPGMPETVNWKKMFKLIDHRRFASFGQVHGLLYRVHDYPLLVDKNAVANQVEPYSRSLLGLVTKVGLLSGTQERRPISRAEPSSRDEQQLRRKLAAYMDGRHCDDELACTFERSFADLLDVFQGSEIVHVFATE
jgi:hypothetical protein